MNKLKTEAKIGIIVLVTIALVIWGINFLKGKNVLKRSDVYHAVYEDLMGIDVSAPVIINGYKIGLVNSIGFSKTSYDKITVSFTVDHSFKIPTGSRVQLYSADLLGSKALRVIPSGSSTYHKYGDTLISSVESDMLTTVSEQLMPLKEKAEEAIEEVDSLLSAVNLILDPKTITELKNSIRNLENISNSFSQQLSENGELQRSFSALANFSEVLSRNKGKLDTVFMNLENISDSLANANTRTLISNISNTFEETSVLLERINSGEGSLGLLAGDDSLYLSLNAAIISLDSLISDLNENPKKYVHFSVFGKKEK